MVCFMLFVSFMHSINHPDGTPTPNRWQTNQSHHFHQLLNYWRSKRTNINYDNNHSVVIFWMSWPLANKKERSFTINSCPDNNWEKITPLFHPSFPTTTHNTIPRLQHFWCERVQNVYNDSSQILRHMYVDSLQTLLQSFPSYA